MSSSGDAYAVTGGAGAIGSRLVRHLLDDGATKVFVLENFSSGHRWLVPKDPRVEVREVDVAELRALPKDLTAVFHLAAHFANQNSVDHPFADLETNGLGTLRVLDAAARARAGKVIFASAGCAAGHEDTPYQIHKTLGEAYCRYFSDRVPTVIARFHNSYGPGEVPGRYRNVVPNFVWAAMRGEPLTIFGDGLDARDFVFVDDLVRELVLLRPSPRPHVLGTSRLTTIHDLVARILDLTGSCSKIVHRPSRRWDHRGRAATCGFFDVTPLEEGLKKTIAWFRENLSDIERSVAQ